MYQLTQLRKKLEIDFLNNPRQALTRLQAGVVVADLDLLQVAELGRFHCEHVGVVALEFIPMSLRRLQIATNIFTFSNKIQKKTDLNSKLQYTNLYPSSMKN